MAPGGNRQEQAATNMLDTTARNCTTSEMYVTHDINNVCAYVIRAHDEYLENTNLLQSVPVNNS